MGTKNKMPTQFQERIYKILRKVPKGKVTTYKALAKKQRQKLIGLLAVP